MVAEEPGTRGAPGWRELLAGRPAERATFERGYERIRALLEHCPEDRHLIHDDLINFNVLVAGDRITAVLDWGSSLFGDFLYDLAKFAFYRPWYRSWRNVDIVGETRRHFARIDLDVPHMNERLTCYALRNGIGDMVWSVWKQRWSAAEQNARRVEEILAEGPA